MSYKRVINGIDLRDSFIDFVFNIKEGEYRLREVYNRTSGGVKIDENLKRLDIPVDQLITNPDLFFLIK